MLAVAHEPSGGQLQKIAISNTLAQCSAGSSRFFRDQRHGLVRCRRLAAMRFQREEIAYNFWAVERRTSSRPLLEVQIDGRSWGMNGG